MMPWNKSASTEKVGGHSEASSTPSRPAGSRADVKDTAAAVQTLRDRIDGTSNLRQFAFDGQCYGLVFAIDDCQHFMR